MTELETIARAKMYIEKLANGVNPLDDTALPDGDIVNNVRISRCLFYVSDILRQVIDNGGTVPPKSYKKDKFYVTSEMLSGYGFTEESIPVSRIADGINAHIDTARMNKISHNHITQWLISLGMLTVVSTSSGKEVKRPTEQGQKLGIFTERRIGKMGEYDVNLYNVDAQHFIIDNIDALVTHMHYTKKKSDGEE